MTAYNPTTDGGKLITAANLQNALSAFAQKMAGTAASIIETLGFTPVDSADLGVNNGVATLDSSGTIPTSQIPTSYITSLINSTITGVYKPAGSKTAAEITGSLLVAANLGNVYNLSTDLTIAAANKGNFVENAENYYPVGTNLVIVDVGTSSSPSYKFDILSGPFTNYVTVGDLPN